MIKPICDFCDQELTEFGGILFSPPQTNWLVRKWHVCVGCMEGLKRMMHKPPKPTDGTD